MSDIPGDLKFRQSHEWARLQDDGLVRVGISDHAQELLGDLVYVELPEVGARLDAEVSAVVVESVKAASDIYPPVSGEVVAINDALDDQPELINADAYGEGWIFVLKPDAREDLDQLLDPDAYAASLEDAD